MAYIDAVTGGRVEQPRRAGVAGIRGGFTMPLPKDVPGDDPIAADASASVTAPLTLAGVLGLQDFGGNPDPDRPARQQADGLLRALAELQRALLGGGNPASALERLESLLNTAPPTANPTLAAVISAVRLRARVELARR